jgi:hypothetical protein
MGAVFQLYLKKNSREKKSFGGGKILVTDFTNFMTWEAT